MTIDVKYKDLVLKFMKFIYSYSIVFVLLNCIKACIKEKLKLLKLDPRLITDFEVRCRSN